MAEGTLVLDANVLIGFYRSEWFENLSFWRPEYEVLTPRLIWEDEFKSSRNIQTPPPWLSVVRVEGEIDPPQPGQLSQYDWRGLLLARNRNGILVTSDGALKDRAEEYGIPTKWTGSFLLETFKSCGISIDGYNQGIENFIADSYLPPQACDELRSAEKS